MHMNMVLFKTTLLVSAILFTIGCGTSRQSSRSGENSGFDLSNRFSSSGHGFSIKYPGTWKSLPTGSVNYVLLGGPRIDSALFMHDGAFALKIFKLPESYNSRSAYEENMKSMREDPTFKDFKIISEDEVLLDGKKAIRVVFTATVGVQTTSLQYYLAIEKKLYILGGSVPMAELGKYDELYSAIANTFDLD